MTSRPCLPSQRRRRLPLALALPVAAAVVAGCASTPKASEDIGMKRVGLSLAFKDEALAKPVPPKVIVNIIPAPPEVIAREVPQLAPFVPPTTARRPTTTPTIPQLCPKAAADAGPDAPAPLVIVKPPKAGKYKRVNTGTIKVSAPPLNLQLPYPPLTVMEVKNVKTETPSPLVPGTASVPVTTFDVVETITPTTVITESYRYDDKAMSLVSRTVRNGTATSTVTPSPSPKVYDFGGIGTSWTDVGLDSAKQTSLVIQGAIRSNRVIDLCGTVIDTFQVTSTTQQVNLVDGSTSGTRTEEGVSDLVAVAPQLGGLFARRELHTRDIIQTDTAPVTLTYDVVSVLGQVEPGGIR